MKRKGQVKISTVIGFIIVISIIFLSWGILLDGFENKYKDTNISSQEVVNSTLQDEVTYNKSTLAENFPSVQNASEDATTEGAYLEIGDVALPEVFLGLISTLSNVSGLVIGQFLGIASFLGLPQALLGLAVVGILIWFVIKIINVFRRFPI